MKTKRILTASVMIVGITTLLTSCAERPVAYVPTSQPATVNATQPAQTSLSGTNQVNMAPAHQPPPAAAGVTVPSAPAPSANAVPHNFSPAVAEVVRLAQSGVGDEVVIAFVKDSQVAYNLSADDIVALKNAGLSSPVMTAMINHDQSLRNQTHAPSYEQKLYAPLTPPVSLPSVTPMPQDYGITGQQDYGTSSAPAAQPTPSAGPSAGVVEQAPPAPRVEMVPVAPGPDYFWVGGYWRWNGAWVWVGGRWVARPWHGAAWVGGHWARHGHGYVWVDGHWR